MFFDNSVGVFFTVLDVESIVIAVGLGIGFISVVGCLAIAVCDGDSDRGGGFGGVGGGHVRAWAVLASLSGQSGRGVGRGERAGGA